MARRFARKPANAELRVYFLAFLFVCGLVVLGGKLWYEQVLRGPKWTSRLASRSEVTVRIPSVRGEIRDRNGLTLVSNRASYEVDFYLPDMVRGYRKEMGTVPVTEYLATVRQMKKKMKEPDIVRIVNESVVPRLHELKLAEDYNSERLQKHFRNDTEVPFAYREEIDFPTIARFAEHNVGLPGVDIGIKPVRLYRYGALAAHLLGYVGAVNDIDQQPDVKDYTFYQPDVEGKSQVELYLDKWIRGTPGMRVMERNVKGVIEREAADRRKAPQQGNNVYLTIDARVQFIVERALRQSNIGRGAAVVVDPRNGDILAMASIPSFDPNIFIPSVSKEDWEKLNDDETDPLTNRAISGYAPGSTYKCAIALAGLSAKIPVNRSYHCSGGVTYGNKYMECWIADKGGSHGSLSLPDALKHSCNAFFYQYGNAAGIEKIQIVGDALGLGKKTNLPLSGENGGILPSPDWLKLTSPNERWSQGYTANTSIGQGFVLASPVQMAMLTATIANRGISYQPRLIHRVQDQKGVDVKDPETGKLVAPHEPTIRADLHKAGVTDQQIEYVREGMRRVVDTGTGKRAQIKGVGVAGKTGTAQFWRGTRKDNHTWFIAFAPYETPTLSVCVMVQGAKSGGGVSAPIVQKIMEECFALEKGYDPGLEAMTPAVGSFRQTELVEFKASAIPAAISGQTDDLETADHADAPIKVERTKLTARPDIRAGADARGRVQSRVFRPAPPVERQNFFQRFFGGRPPPPRAQPVNPSRGR